LRIDPNLATVCGAIGNAYVEVGGWQLEHDSSPTDSIEKGRRATETDLKLDSTLSGNYQTLAALSVLEARYQMKLGDDPLEALKRSRSELAKAIEMSPNDSDAHRTAAE